MTDQPPSDPAAEAEATTAGPDAPAAFAAPQSPDADSAQPVAEPVAVPPAPVAEPEPAATATPPPPEPTPTISASDASSSRPAGSAAAPSALSPQAYDDRPEVLVGAAFAGGILAALILKRLGR